MGVDHFAEQQLGAGVENFDAHGQGEDGREGRVE
jgi:hypothetical protein